MDLADNQRWLRKPLSLNLRRFLNVERILPALYAYHFIYFFTTTRQVGAVFLTLWMKHREAQ